MFICVHLAKGVPSSEHSINTPLISQQCILNSDELIFLVLGWKKQWKGGRPGKVEVHWVQNSNKERTG